MISISEILNEYPELFKSRHLVHYWIRKIRPSKVREVYISPLGHKEFRLTEEEFKELIFERLKHLKAIKGRKSTGFLRKLTCPKCGQSLKGE